MENNLKPNRILTGDRPTGALHLGHLVGSLQKRVELQDKYQTFIIVADLHSLTTKSQKSEIADIQDRIRNQVLTYLAVGLDPHKVTIYRQSAIPEVCELFVILSMIISVARLERVPTLKEQMDNLHITNASLGLLEYPVLMASDILMVGADTVPVGVDQSSHLEVTREIAARFNQMYGNTLPEPKALLSNTATLIGTDGNAKMSKSLGNAIGLLDDPEVVTKKVMSMYTDPNRIRKTDPGKVEGNPVFIYHDLFNANKDQVADFKDRYAKGQVGDVEVKKALAVALNKYLDPIRDRAKLHNKRALLDDILEQGTIAARKEAIKTLDNVKSAMGL
ncbi:MAG: tryptophan--tRNA ligase [Patescibacteria group bacterium]|jgi:tryptophanyl-tRNA synthetase